MQKKELLLFTGMSRGHNENEVNSMEDVHSFHTIIFYKQIEYDSSVQSNPNVTDLKGLKFFICYWWTSIIADL